ncbi:MAG: GNAT family N-acetyltransferase [Candidatus Dormibacteria bacterium]
MGDPDDVRIETLEDHEDAEVRAMLVDLALAEQRHFDHPEETSEQLSGRLSTSPRFTGENHILVARTPEGDAIGLCWVVLFDPGTGLEAEIAELYVRPQGRGQGVAHRLMAEAMRLIRSREVTFACVWTRGDNHAALAAYVAAGFAPTEQTVLTWLPLEYNERSG